MTTKRSLSLVLVAVLAGLLLTPLTDGSVPYLGVVQADDPCLVLGKTAQEVAGCRRYEVTLTITGSPPGMPVDIVLLFDASTSMRTGSPYPLAYAKQAALALAQLVLQDANNRVAVVRFADSAVADQGLTNSLTSVQNAINAIVGGGGTDMAAGFNKARQQFVSYPRSGAAKAIILLSDGCARTLAGDNCWSNEWPTAPSGCTEGAIQAAQAAWSLAKVYSVGLLSTVHSMYPASEAVAVDTLNRVQNAGYLQTYGAIDLTPLYAAIKYQAPAASNAVVTDLVSEEFVIDATSLSATRGTITLTGNTITWGVGTVRAETLTLTYQVSARPGYSGSLAVNDQATMTYTDGAGTAGQTLSFPSPAVVVPPDLVASAGPDQTIAPGGSVQIGGSPAASGGIAGYTYNWQPAAGLSDAHAPNPLASPAETATYQLTVTDAAGCTATDSVLVAVSQAQNRPPIAQDDGVATCAGTAVTVDLLANDHDPDSGDTLDLASVTVTAGPAHGSAVVDTASGTVTYTPQASFSGNDTFAYIVRDSHGAASNEGTVTVLVRANPVASFDFNPTPACAGSPLQFAAQPAGDHYTYTWAFGDGTTGSGQSISHAYAAAGTYHVTLTVTDANGCIDSETRQVVVEDCCTVSVTASVTGPDCDGKVTLTAAASGGKGALSYEWFDGATSLGVGNPLQVTLGIGSHSLKVKVTDAGVPDCYAESSPQTVTYEGKPAVAITPKGGTLTCTNPTLTLTASTAGSTCTVTSYQWSGPGGNLGTAATQVVSAPGQYTVRVICANGCWADDAVTVGEDKAAPVVTLSKIYDHCAGQVTFAAAATGGTGPYSYVWTGSGTVDGADPARYVVSGYGASGSVSVRVTGANGCWAIGTDTYAINGQLDVQIVSTVYDHCAGTVTFTALASGGNGSYIYTWNKTGGAVGTVDPNNPARYTLDATSAQGTVTVTVTDGNGCTDSDDSAYDINVPSPSIEVFKSVDQPIVHEGTEVEYTYEVVNTSYCPLLDVTLVDDKLGAIALSGGDLADLDGDGQADDLPYGGSVIVKVRATITVDTGNEATGAGTNLRGVRVEDRATAQVRVIHPCISLEKEGPANAYVAEKVTYRFTLKNCSGDAALHDVTVTDAMLGGVIWSGSLTIGEEVQFSKEYAVPGNAPSPLCNRAVAQGLDILEKPIRDEAEACLYVLRPLGLKFWDKESDQVWQRYGDPLLPNWPVRLLNVQTRQSFTVYTHADSKSPYYGWWFPPKEMPAGEYRVEEFPRDGWDQTYPGVNGGWYHIRYHVDGSYELLSPLPKGAPGLSFGNTPAVRVPCATCSEWVVFDTNRDGNWELYAMHADGSRLTRLTNDAGVDKAPALIVGATDAETWAVFQSNRSGKWDIYRVNVLGQGLKRLTTAGNNTDPVWSCESGRVAFVSDRDGNPEVYVMDEEGNGQLRLTYNRAEDTNPAWSGDGKRVVFQSDRDGNWEVYSIDATGQYEKRLTSDGAEDVGPQWSPDGQRIAYQSRRGGAWQVYVMPASGGLAVRVSRGSGDSAQAVWSPDGTKLAYRSNRDGNWEIYVVDLQTGEEVRVTEDPAQDVGATWSCGSDTLVFQTDRDGNWELYHVVVADGSVLARLTDDVGADVTPVWNPAEEDGELPEGGSAPPAWPQPPLPADEPPS